MKCVYCRLTNGEPAAVLSFEPDEWFKFCDFLRSMVGRIECIDGLTFVEHDLKNAIDNGIIKPIKRTPDAEMLFDKFGLSVNNIVASIDCWKETRGLPQPSLN